MRLLWRSYNAKLLHHAQLIENLPPLHQFTVGNAIYFQCKGINGPNHAPNGVFQWGIFVAC
jgi:hypothetical protein